MRTIRSFLPFGAIRFDTPQKGADYGLVFQCGKRELFGIKRQPVDCDEQQGLISFQANSILIADSLAGYLARGYSGLLMPCAYLRKKENNRAESGIALFGYPSAQGQEAREHCSLPAYDGQFGHGFTTMMTSYLNTLQQSSDDTGISLPPCIGLDVRYRSQFGSLGFGFMIVGRHIACLKTVVSPQDLVWTALRAAGITEVFHIPSVPTTVGEDQLNIAKPGMDLAID